MSWSLLPHLIWLIVNWVTWSYAPRFWPAHTRLIHWLVGPLIAIQLYAIGHAAWAAYRQSLQDNLMQRVHDDELEESYRELGDNSPLRRYQDLSTKPVAEMTGEELATYMRKLHGRPNLEGLDG